MDIQALVASAIENSTLLFDGVENTTELRDCLSSLLPDGNHNVKNIKGKPERFIAEFDIDLHTEDDVNKFIEGYCTKTNEVLRSETTR